MIVLINLVIMFGFWYFASLGVRTFWHYRKLIKKLHREEFEREQKLKRDKRRRRTVDMGTIYGSPSPGREMKQVWPVKRP